MFTKLTPQTLPALLLPLFLLAPAMASGQIEGLYGKSYALVVGIDEYPHPEWPDLPFARKDAEAIARLLRAQGFDEVVPLYDEQATRAAIISALEEKIAPKLQAEDRVVLFFSGHGATQHLASNTYGYLVPHDGTSSPSTWLAMTTLREISEKLGTAKHQLFILDACFGGTLEKGGSVVLSHAHPNYIKEVARRPARQYLTAGGQDQKVRATGPHGHSYFTGYLLEALEEGLGELNADGYITALELAQYLQTRAANEGQTPGFGDLPGHGLGTFLFRAPGTTHGSRGPSQPAVESPISNLGLKGAVEVIPIEAERSLTNEAKLRDSPSPAANTVLSLAPGTKIWVAGKLRNSDWLLVEHGTQTGYLIAEAIYPEKLSKTTDLGARPPTSTTTGSNPWLGVSYEDITPEVRGKYGLPTNQTGVRVTHVASTSPLRAQGLRVGDIITEVHARRVANVADFEAEVAAGKSGTSLRFWVERHNPRMPRPQYDFVFAQVP